MSNRSMAFGALKKIEGVLVIAREDKHFCVSLASQPELAVSNADLDLTRSEVEALLDIVSGTKQSSFNIKPENSYFDKMQILREQWHDIKASFNLC